MFLCIAMLNGLEGVARIPQRKYFVFIGEQYGLHKKGVPSIFNLGGDSLRDTVLILFFCVIPASSAKMCENVVKY